jgi:hypothetical protein
MAWGSSTLGTASPLWGLPSGISKALSFLGKGATGPASALTAPFSTYGSGRIAEKSPGLMSINPLAAPGFLFKHYTDKLLGWDADSMIAASDMTDEEIAGVRGVGHFTKSMEDSVKKAATDTEEEDPFNYNQLFIASILKGLKQKPPAQSSGRAAGTYIPRPDLPMMSDYDSNKTYWNIG